MSEQKVDRPNILFICSDQHSYRFTGYAGHDYVETPNLDALAEQGAVFENAYCNNPVCTPSRASLMTGVFSSDVGSYCNATVWDGSSPTWGTRLREAGYYTWATGKLDLNADHNIGFDQVNTNHGHWDDPDITSLFRRPVLPRNRTTGKRKELTGKPRNEPHQNDQTATKNAEAFLREEAPDIDAPWAAYVGYLQPHSPFEALPEYFDRYYPTKVEPPNLPAEHLDDQHPVEQDIRYYGGTEKPIPEEQARRARAGYYGMITELDDYIGRIRNALKESGELENTVFIYTSDHGEMLGEHGQWGKISLYEDSVHVPLVIAGPDLPRGKRIERTVSLIDLVSTILEWGDTELDPELRGHSLTPVLTDKASTDDHPGYAFAESHGHGTRTGGFMIREGKWKYLHYTWHDDRLYNLEEDPLEFNNRIGDPEVQDIRTELHNRLTEEVDPESVTLEAFNAQESMLEEMATTMTEDELTDQLTHRSRIDVGLARLLANKYT